MALVEVDLVVRPINVYYSLSVGSDSFLVLGVSSSPAKNPSAMFALTSSGLVPMADPESVFVKPRTAISPNRKGE